MFILPRAVLKFLKLAPKVTFGRTLENNTQGSLGAYKALICVECVVLDFFASDVFEDDNLDAPNLKDMQISLEVLKSSCNLHE